MGTVEFAALGVAGAVVLLGGLIVALILWESFSGARVRSMTVFGSSTSTPAPSGTGVTTTVKKSVGKVVKSLPILIGIAVVVALALIFGPGLKDIGSGMDISSFILQIGTLVLLIALVIAGIKGVGGIPFRVLAGVLVLTFIIFGKHFPEFVDYVNETSWKYVTKESKPVPTTANVPTLAVVREDKIRWKETTEDGSLPVGVWSETFMVPLATSVFLTNGNGELYVVRYKFNHEKDWATHIPGTNVAGDEIQYKILERGRGMKQAPVSIVRR